MLETKLKEMTEIHIIESPSKMDLLNEVNETNALSAMMKLSGIKHFRYQVSDKVTLQIALNKIAGRTAKIQKNIAMMNIHLSCHGNKAGFSLTSGDFIDWHLFYQLLGILVKQLGLLKMEDGLQFLPLALTFSTCNGINGFKISSHTKDSYIPFTHLVGPNQEVDWHDSLVAFTVYFHNLLSHNQKLPDCVSRMNDASNCPGVFEVKLHKNFYFK